MTNPDELLRLAERVEQGSGEDRDLDRDVALATGLTEVPHPFPDPDRVYSEYRRRNPDGSHSTGSFYVMIRSVTSSIDAVEGLRERLLPGSMVTVDTIRVAGAIEVIAAIWPPTVGTGVEATAPTEARARLAALLRAVAGKEG